MDLIRSVQNNLTNPYLWSTTPHHKPLQQIEKGLTEELKKAHSQKLVTFIASKSLIYPLNTKTVMYTFSVTFK